MNSFLSRENVDMLVEILLDDKPNKNQGDVNQIIQEINVFRNTHLNSSSVSNVSLLELNQQFLKRMISHSLQSQPTSSLQSSMPTSASLQSHSSLQSSNMSLQQSLPPSSLQSSSSYRNEDLKAERLDFFDKQLNQKRQEFESAITLKKPTPPIFEDSKMLDKPIANMEELIAQTMAQRNFDITNIGSPQSSDWLSPISTSVKVEKQELNGMEEKEKEREKKTISFEEPPITNSIFARLKPTNSLESQIEILTNRVTLLEEQIVELRSLMK
jgi:polyhydroxyalkanoate synthesis regulator phasin